MKVKTPNADPQTSLMLNVGRSCEYSLLSGLRPDVRWDLEFGGWHFHAERDHV